MVVLNDAAQTIVERKRGQHPVYVFTWVNDDGVMECGIVRAERATQDGATLEIERQTVCGSFESSRPKTRLLCDTTSRSSCRGREPADWR